MKVYAAQEVHAALTWVPLAYALERAFIAGAQVPLRHAHALSPHDTLLLMPAWNAQVIVLKLVTVMPGSRRDRAGDAARLRSRRRRAAGGARRRGRHAAPHRGDLGAGRATPRAGRCPHAADRGHRAAGAMDGASACALRPGLRRVQVWGRQPRASTGAGRASWPPRGCPRSRCASSSRQCAAPASCAAPPPRPSRWCTAPGSRRARTWISSAASARTCARWTMRRWPARASSWTRPPARWPKPATWCNRWSAA